MKRYICGTIYISLLIIFVYVHVSNSLAPYTLSDHVIAGSFRPFWIIEGIDLDLTHESLGKNTVSVKVIKRLTLRELKKKLSFLNKLMENFLKEKTISNYFSIDHYKPDIRLRMRGEQQKTDFTYVTIGGKHQNVRIEGKAVVNVGYTKNQVGFPKHKYVVVTYEAYEKLYEENFPGLEYVTPDGVQCSIIPESQSMPEEVIKEFADSKTGFKFKPLKVRLKKLKGLRDIFTFISRDAREEPPNVTLEQNRRITERKIEHPGYVAWLKTGCDAWLKTVKIGGTYINYEYWQDSDSKKPFEKNKDFFKIVITDADKKDVFEMKYDPIKKLTEYTFLGKNNKKTHFKHDDYPIAIDYKHNSFVGVVSDSYYEKIINEIRKVKGFSNFYLYGRTSDRVQYFIMSESMALKNYASLKDFDLWKRKRDLPAAFLQSAKNLIFMHRAVATAQ